MNGLTGSLYHLYFLNLRATCVALLGSSPLCSRTIADLSTVVRYPQFHTTARDINPIGAYQRKGPAQAGGNRLYTYLKVLKQLRTPLGAKFIDYLRKHNWPAEYTPEELKEKYVFLEWVACPLCFQRPIKTRQLFFYGWPSTQKTLLVSFLSKVFRLYFGSSRRNDFTGADNYSNLWVFD